MNRHYYSLTVAIKPFFIFPNDRSKVMVLAVPDFYGIVGPGHRMLSRILCLGNLFYVSFIPYSIVITSL